MKSSVQKYTRPIGTITSLLLVLVLVLKIMYIEHQNKVPWNADRSGMLMNVLANGVLQDEVNKAEGKQPKDKPKKKDGNKIIPPLAKYFKVEHPIDDKLFNNIRSALVDLQKQSADEDRRAFLFLEIRPGNSESYQIIGLAKLLSSAEYNRVTTVAWLPETVVGYAAILPLGCNEIVIHPDASLGDIGRGKSVENEDRLAALAIVDKRHNRLVNRAIAEGMMNPNQSILLASLQIGDKPKETRVVTPDELEILRKNRANILDVNTIKEKGEPGLFSGSQAKGLEFLVAHLAKARSDVSEIYGVDPSKLREEVNSGFDVKVRLIRVTDMIDPVLEAFIERQVERSISDGANLLIFEIDSGGGLLVSAQALANYLAELGERNVRTVAFIPQKAYSGAALVALGCDEIYLQPNGQIGDAGAIAELGKEGKFEHVPEKLLGPYKETLKTLAEMKDRPNAILEAMAFKDLKVYEVTHRENGRVWFMSEQDLHNSNGEWIQGAAIPEAGNSQLLTVKGERAVELKIAKAVVRDLDDLKTRLNIPLNFKLNPVGRTWLDTLVFILSSSFVTGFLFFIALLCLYIELHFFTGFFAIVAALCFGIFFWSRFLGGTAGWLEVMFFLLGLVFLGMEIFVIPGFGVFGVSGILLIIASLVMASQTFNNIEPSKDLDSLANSLSSLAGSLVAVVVIAMVLQKYLPSIPLFNRAMLIPPGSTSSHDGSPRLRPDLMQDDQEENEHDLSYLVGYKGLAKTLLRPSGRARIDDKIVDVISEGGFIKEGSSIEVVHVSGNRIIVRENT